jgi:hypothetical protein
MHDHNTTKFIECIKTSHDVCGANNLIAIKVTALIRPNVLKKFNILLKSIENRSLLPPLFELINQEQTTVTLFQQSVNPSSVILNIFNYQFVDFFLSVILESIIVTIDT